MTEIVYTVGHSNLLLESFLQVIASHGVNAVADVRSYPYSNVFPHFDREPLKESLKERGVAYVFLGKELGARSELPSCYEDGRVQFDRIANTSLFREGISRVIEGTKRYRIALMCAEKEPLSCHRTLLVSRYLIEEGVSIRHILSEQEIEDHSHTMERLVKKLELDRNVLFSDRQQQVLEAYRRQGQEIAYQRENETAASARR